MIRYLVAAAFALLAASPAYAADTCATPADAKVATSTNTAALNKGVACRTERIKGRESTIVGLQAANKVDADQVAARVARLDQLAKPTPPAAPAATKLAGLVAEGDGLTGPEWGGNYPGIYRKLRPGVQMTVLAKGGARINDAGGGNGLVQRLPALIAAKPAAVTVLIGANDLGDGQYATPEAWLAALWGYVGQVKATGAKVAVGTVLPICFTSNASYTARHLQRRAVVNPAIRAAVGSKIDAVIDYAADDKIGPDGAACARTWYKDEIHTSDGDAAGNGGEGRMAQIFALVADKLLAGAPAAAVPAPAAPIATVPVPAPAGGVIASNFDRLSLIGDGGRIPASGKPDVVGAFRFICQPGQLLADDPILWPGQPGRAHLHQFFGNTLADANSTFASLRTTGESTCMNKLNRSAYWMPAMLNAAGLVIRPDFYQLYYKRLPASDPECKRQAEACVGIPNGFQVIEGWPRVYSNAQEEKRGADGERTFSWRCETNQIHRHDAAQALADCGGSGRILVTIAFGSCWNGEATSKDGRSHLVHQVRDPNSGKPECPKTHRKMIPALTQTAAYTVLASDLPIRLSNEEPGDAPGSKAHGDYGTAWDDQTLATAMANCIDKLLTCVDGELGDGTIMKRWSGFGYVANPRLVAPPAGYSVSAMVH